MIFRLVCGSLAPAPSCWRERRQQTSWAAATPRSLALKPQHSPSPINNHPISSPHSSRRGDLTPSRATILRGITSRQGRLSSIPPGGGPMAAVLVITMQQPMGRGSRTATLATTTPNLPPYPGTLRWQAGARDGR
eukprot:scaffold2813_cov81-Phaeocystis_antarctica.AAC.1